MSLNSQSDIERQGVHTLSPYPKSRRGREYYHLKGNKPRPICENCSKPPDKYQYLVTAYVRKWHEHHYDPEHPWLVKRYLKLVKIGLFCNKCGYFERREIPVSAHGTDQQ